MKITNPELAVDVSLWDFVLNTHELEDGGVRAVIVKMGSNKTLDPKFRKHAEAVSKSSMMLMVYHWDDIIYDPVAQAQWAAETAKNSGYPIKFIWMDMEQYWINWSTKQPGTKVNIDWHSRKYAETLRALYPNFGIYSGFGFITTWLPSTSTWINQYKIWYPQYQVYLPTVDMEWETLKQSWMPNYDLRLAPAVDPAKIFGHQFTGDRVRMRGIYDAYGRWMRTDVNVFNREFLNSIGGVTPIPTPIPVPIPTYKTYKVVAWLLNIRPTPDTTGAPIRTVPYGTLLKVVSITNGWAKLLDGGYASSYYLQLVL